MCKPAAKSLGSLKFVTLEVWQTPAESFCFRYHTKLSLPSNSTHSWDVHYQCLLPTSTALGFGSFSKRKNEIEAK